MKLALIQLLGDEINNYKKTGTKIELKIIEACKNGADFIVLPECSYPSYLLGYDKKSMENALSYTDEFIQRIASLAANYSVYIAIGVALNVGEQLYNATLVYDRSGKIINRAFKSFLWHFDDKWFKAGEVAEVFDTEFGKIGVMICADGRIPEVARILKLRGADLIIDPVNLAANAVTADKLSNQQYEFILQTRARENDVYIVACDKCGVEANLATFLGRSFVSDREGNIILQCSPDKEEIAYCKIELKESSKLDNRRPELYEELIVNTDELIVTKKANKYYDLKDLAIYTMVIRFQYMNKNEYIEQAKTFIKGSELMYSDLIVLPELKLPDKLDKEMLREIQSVISKGQTIVLAGCEIIDKDITKKAYVITSENVLGEFQCTHSKKLLNSSRIEVIDLSPVNSISVIFDDEISIPEISRVAMLKGADVIVSYDNDMNSDWHIRMLKTRAAENKVYVIRSSSSELPSTSMIFNPEGGQVCTTFETLHHASVGYINTAQSKFKSIVPGTNIVLTRKPKFYKEMI